MYSKSRLLWLFCACVTLLLNAVCMLLAWETISNLVFSLTYNPMLFSAWAKIPVPLRTEFYFFNWTNPEDIHNESIKPNFVELGPYIFAQTEQKTDIVWNNNGTITFRQRKFWYYDKTTRNRPLDELVTSLDPLLLTLAYVTKSWNYFLRKSIFFVLSPHFNQLDQTRPVKELLFDGFKEPLIRIARALPFLAYLELPDWEKFGWLYSRNGTSDFDGTFNMGTGVNSDMGIIYNHNYNSRTKYYNGTCGKVHGTSGQLYPRNLKKDFITIYSSDLRRFVKFAYSHETLVKNVVGNTYIAGKTSFDNGTLNPENACFCADECIPSGMLNLSLSRHHSPLFASWPHFYNADSYYLDRVTGLKPNRTKHEMSITIEPITGVVLEVDGKIQVNLLVQKVSGLSLFENVPKTYFPIFWTRQKAVLPDREVLLLKIYLVFNSLRIGLGIFALGTLMTLLLYEYYLFYNRIQNMRKKRIYENVPLQKNFFK